MEFSLKQLFKKNWLAIVTTAITVAVLVYFLVTTDGINAFLSVASDLKVSWIVLMFVAVFANWALEGTALHYITRRIYPDWPLKNSIVIGMVGLLYGALTPFSSGGQPMQVYFMKKMGADPGKAAAVITVKTMVYQVVMVIFAVVMVVWKLPFFQQQNISNFWFITLIGLAANLLFISAVFFFSFHQKLTSRIVTALINLLHKMHLCKNPEKRKESILGAFRMYFESTRLVGRSVSMYLVVGIMQMAQIFVTCIVPYCIYRSFGFHGASLMNMVAAQSFVTMVSAFVPLPGASGGAEGSFYIYFNMFFQKNTLVPAIFIWRIMTYYLTIFVGCFFAVFGKRIPCRTLRENPKLAKVQLQSPDDIPFSE
ncbi:MAG: lysylphosphatidylglycerol synthase transmembrane domain-containing protein [Oscillospiraceae bacterium]|nr:lysylphosphatidylglycerol synthase transmembrane domain-containing protein [Oscillospiraceae bacterium]